MIKIRIGKKSDLPEILELIKELADYEHALNEVSVTLKQLELDGFGKNPAYYLLIAEKDDDIVEEEDTREVDVIVVFMIVFYFGSQILRQYH